MHCFSWGTQVATAAAGRKGFQVATEGFYLFLLNAAEPKKPPCAWLALPSPPASLPVPPPPRRETSRAPRLLGNTATSAQEVSGRDCLSTTQAELPSFLISCRPICTPPCFLQGQLARQTQSPSPPGCPAESKEALSESLSLAFPYPFFPSRAGGWGWGVRF